jgi:large subunit ribosomal protein L24
MHARNRAVVEGLNLVKKTLRKSQDHPQGGIIDKEASIHLSNLRLVEVAEQKAAARKKTPKKKTSKSGDA